ncbi:hypothetical protein S83_038747 [Arachis hypogaea]
MAKLCTVTLGGNGSSFSSTISAVAASLAHVRIDTSALDRLSFSLSSATPLLKHTIAIPSFLSLSGTRTFLLVLLNKLLLSPPPVVILEKWLGLRETLGFLAMLLALIPVTSSFCSAFQALHPFRQTRKKRKIRGFLFCLLEGLEVLS